MGTPTTISPKWAVLPTTPRPASAPTIVTPPTNIERVNGMTQYQFSFLNLTTSVQATRNIGGTLATIGVRMPYPGSVIGLSFESNAAKTAGTVVFTPYIAGVAQVGTLGWNASNSGAVQTFTPGLMVFNSGDSLDVRATTTSFAPTTADVDVLVYVSFSS